ncbi:hypothetical protein KUCAC02_016838 [Chaenocephalus aceratus]|nr:hypothetical protein KUCAC02_016838 [Chaenocephalus aceratus]
MQLMRRTGSPMNADIGLGAESVIKALQSTPGSRAGDVIVQQSERFLCVEGRGEGFLSFQHLSSGSMFSCTKLSAHPELRRFCQSLPLLSHGQATVERGFSANKEVENCQPP